MAPIPIDIDVLVVGAFAPIVGVTTFWFLQLILIEIQKRLISKLRHHHEAFCRFTNFIGIFFQTICHAFGYTVTRSGIASFTITVNYGQVQPKKEKKGVLEWIARSFLLFGPFFIPAGFVLLVSFLVIRRGFTFPNPVNYTFVESLVGFYSNMLTYTHNLSIFLISIDLFNPLYLGYLFLLLFFGLGIRPSYIGKERKEKIDLLHDLKQIKNHLMRKPRYILTIFFIIYIFYLLSLFLNPVLYVGLFTILGWMSLTAIIAILLTLPALLLIKATDSIQKHWKILPFITLVASYVLTRIFFIYYKTNQSEGISLLVMILSTFFLTIILIQYKRTHSFKTKPKMKLMRVADGKKRASKKRED